MASDLTESVVKAELQQLDRFPVSPSERKLAERAISRFKSKPDPSKIWGNRPQIQLTEEWVQLYVALRRGCGDDSRRLYASHLRRWSAYLCPTAKRRPDALTESLSGSQGGCLDGVASLIDKSGASLDLPGCVNPRGDLGLPADIYGDDAAFIDTGYDRSKLKMPGLGHLETAVKWARDGLHWDREDDSGTAAPAAELPEPPAAAAPAAELPAPPAAAAPAAELPAVMRIAHCPLQRESDEQ